MYLHLQSALSLLLCVRLWFYVLELKKSGSTPIWIAAHNGHLKVVEFLAEAKADPSLPDKVWAETRCTGAWCGSIHLVIKAISTLEVKR